MNGGLLMLAGHAIYQGGRWHGGHQNEDRLYERHVRDAFGIFANEGYQALALSGGRSRPQLTRRRFQPLLRRRPRLLPSKGER